MLNPPCGFQVEKVLQRELTMGIKDKYSLSNRENDQRGLRDAWDFVQQKVRPETLY